MTNPDEEAKERHDAAKARLDAAEVTRVEGSKLMVAGGLLAAGAATAFTFADAMEIQSWVRQTILTVIAIIFSAGVVRYSDGRSSARDLAQMADDRAEHEETRRRLAVVEVELASVKREVVGLRAEMADVLLEVRKNQILLLSRPGAEDAKLIELTERFQDLEADLAGVRLWQKQIHEEWSARLNGKVTDLRPLPSQQN